MSFEVIKRSAGINMTFVPFRHGTRDQHPDGRRRHRVFADYPTVVGHFAERHAARPRHRLAKRNPALPDDAHIRRGRRDADDADISLYGIVAPTKTPPEALKQLAAWFGAALKAPDASRAWRSRGCSSRHVRRAVRRFHEAPDHDYARMIREWE